MLRIMHAYDKIKALVEKHVGKNEYPPFHLVNTLGWIVLIIADTFIVSPNELLWKWHWILSNTTQWISGYFITVYLRRSYIKYNYRAKSILKLIVFILITSLIASILFFFVAHFVLLLFELQRSPKILRYIFSFKYLIDTLTRFYPLMTTWSLLYFGLKFWIDLLSEIKRAEKADLLAQSAQLQMLRYQINPHFLFNSFSSLRALIRTNSDKAEEMVGKLSEFFRYTLIAKLNTEVPLSNEIEAISHYAEIEKIRFEDKIDFDFCIDASAEDYPVPSFLIHPLVENAIKYGMASSPIPLKVKILANVENGWLIIQVLNSGTWIDPKNKDKNNGTGTGLSNIKSRLEYSYPGNSSFEVKQKEGMVVATIKLFRGLK
jgi:sensor histidine kinase YesM